MVWSVNPLHDLANVWELEEEEKARDSNKWKGTRMKENGWGNDDIFSFAMEKCLRQNLLNWGT